MVSVTTDHTDVSASRVVPVSSGDQKRAVIGIIYPPPEVRNIVDKTANFVARNGPEFESRIRQNEINNSKFNFLNSGDPYHAYYQHKVKEFCESKADFSTSIPGVSLPPPPPLAPPTVQSQDTQQALRSVVALLDQRVVLKEPPEPFEYIVDPPSIAAYDLDIVKLTAQFVARNGKQFLNSLIGREQRNYQFDFLRPQHSLYNYYTKLLDQYSKILLPSKALLADFRDEVNDMSRVLKRVRYRVAWCQREEDKRRAESEALERERVAYAEIDWHDFVVVETVDYQPGEVGQFPPPATPDSVGQLMMLQDRYEAGEKMQFSDDENDDDQRSLSSADTDTDDSIIMTDDEDTVKGKSADTSSVKHIGERVANNRVSIDKHEFENKKASDVKNISRSGREEISCANGDKVTSDLTADNVTLRDNIQVTDMEQDSSDDESPDAVKTNNEGEVRNVDVNKESFAARMPPLPDQVVVRDYDPKSATKRSTSSSIEQYLISPITGERIPAKDAADHMRYGLLDPRWMEQRDRHMSDKLSASRQHENVFAAGGDISSHLQNLAERRTDIFGAGHQETGIGQKITDQLSNDDDKVDTLIDSSNVVSQNEQYANKEPRASSDILLHQVNLMKSQEDDRVGVTGSTLVDRFDNQVDVNTSTLSSFSEQPSLQGNLSSQSQLPHSSISQTASIASITQTVPTTSILQATPLVPQATPLIPQATPLIPQATPTPLIPQATPTPLIPQAVAPALMSQGVSGTPIPLAMGAGLLPNVRPPVLLPARPQSSPLFGLRPGVPLPTPMMPMQQQQMSSTPHDTGAPSKRARTEGQLMPEQEWLSHVSSQHAEGAQTVGGIGPQVTFSVRVPVMKDKPEWRMQGQLVSLSMPLTDTVSVIKARLHDETGMPTGKQKLAHEGIFFKDSNTLAYYNVCDGMKLQLQLKERGGRKK